MVRQMDNRNISLALVLGSLQPRKKGVVRLKELEQHQPALWESMTYGVGGDRSSFLVI